MRSDNLHIIQKQTIEIEFENIDDSFGVQDRVAQVFYENLQPRMEILLDEMFGKDQYASIDKLEIDCGVLSIENWEQEFTAQAMLKMKEGLVQVSRQKIDVNVKEETNAAETFFFFLENGYLPWKKRISTISELEQRIKVEDEFIIRLKKLILQKLHVAKRLASQFSEEFISKLLTAYTQNRKQEAELLSAITEKVNAMESVLLRQDRNQKQLINETFLTVFASENYKIREIEFFTFLLSKVENNDNLKSETGEIIRKLHAQPEKRNLEKEEILMESGLNQRQEKASEKPDEPIALENQEPALRLRSVPENQKQFSESTKPSDTIYINNAGLVLLHPFLPALFSHLKLIEENAWIDEAFVYKAILAMQFMVNGKDEIEEFDLVLNKILCGIDNEEVVPTTILPDEETKTECDVLLMEVIKHWDVLKNTSIAGLREGFLQRSGKLSRVDDGWLLQVEQKAIDVLLNHLPWGIGIIKLPWMNEILVVEWT
jgi:hypothetical protein